MNGDENVLGELNIDTDILDTTLRMMGLSIPKKELHIIIDAVNLTCGNGNQTTIKDIHEVIDYNRRLEEKILKNRTMNKNDIIKLAKEKGFISKFIHVAIDLKEIASYTQWYLWLRELQLWLDTVHFKPIDIITDCSYTSNKEHNYIFVYSTWLNGCIANDPNTNYESKVEALEDAVVEVLNTIDNK